MAITENVVITSASLAPNIKVKNMVWNKALMKSETKRRQLLTFERLKEFTSRLMCAEQSEAK